MSSIYLDYAATSAIRPPEVIDAVVACLRDIGATPGRSGHARALDAGRIALRGRRLLAELLGIPGDPGRIAYQQNATHALNTALFGVLAAGDRVVRTRYDHNAVRRPLAALAGQGVSVDLLEIDRDGGFDRGELADLLRGEDAPARMLVVPHASNVTGAVLPVREMTEMAHEFGALVLVDLAQTAGHYPVDLEAMQVDLAAFTGHKGLLGPQGIGGLWVRDGVAVRPMLHGGTGGDSGPLDMPAAYPDHLEAGTQNAPGIAGLAAGVAWVLERGIETIHAREDDLKKRLVTALEDVPRVRILSPPDVESVGIVSLVVDGQSPADVALCVERSHGVQGRAGLHCAPDAHIVLGTLNTGAFRLSLGWASTPADVDAAAAALKAIHRVGEVG